MVVSLLGKGTQGRSENGIKKIAKKVNYK